MPTASVLVYALHHPKWRLFAAGVVWTVVNPFVFLPPGDEAVWMTRACLAERWWTSEAGNRTVGRSYPNVFSAGRMLATMYAMYAAWRQRPAGTAVGTALASP